MDLREVKLPTEQRQLTQPPSLGRLFASAALTAKGRGGNLPGHALQQTGARVDPGQLVEYSRVCGFPLTGAAPITFLHVLAFPAQVALMTDRAFPFPLPGLVHLSNRMTQFAPVQPGEDLEITVWVADLQPHPKGTTVELFGRITRAGEPVWAGQSTYLRRGPGQGRSGEQDIITQATTLGGRWRIPADAGRRYARVSGDVNPIHLHPLTARAMGMPGAIAHGMWTHARSVAALGSKAPHLADVSVTFQRPVRLPSTVDVRFSTSGDAQAVTITRRADSEKVLLRTVVRPALS